MYFRTNSLWLALACMLCMACTAEACPTCKAALAENGGDVARGYFWSILFMMSMPFLILGGLGSLFYLEVRRARVQQIRVAPGVRADDSQPVAVSVGGTS